MNMKKVKIVLIGFIALLGLFFLVQMVSSIPLQIAENYHYEVMEKYDEFEIRAYEAASFCSITIGKASTFEDSQKSFRSIAQYLLGDNRSNQRIGMTKPVQLGMGDSIEVALKVPNHMQLQQMPKAENPCIQCFHEQERIMAVIRFNGWMSQRKFEKYASRLKEQLDKHNIQTFGDFIYHGYNPPYELLNRRNEILIAISNHHLTSA
jgi:hypothetical protein